MTLIQSALDLSRKSLLVPLRQTTAEFLSQPRSSAEYNLYLQAISNLPFRSPESTHTVSRILQQHPVTLTAPTYSALLRPSFTTLPLLSCLSNTLPTPNTPLPILLSFLAAYSKLDVPYKAAEFFHQISNHPHITPSIRKHASTLLIAVQRNHNNAYNALIAADEHSSFNASASFHALTKDLSLSHNQLIQTFTLLLKHNNNPPLLPLYTSLINALILRHRHSTASVFFAKLLKQSPNTIDLPALAAGINALTRSGHPHKAFQILQSHYPSALLHSNNSSPSLPLLTFLVALNRISRPDISSLLFFLYPSLYPSLAPPPSSQMLDILLQSARSALKIDHLLYTAKQNLPISLLRYLHSKHKNPSVLHRFLNLKTSAFIHKALGHPNLSLLHLISKPLPPFGRRQQSNPTPLQATNLILTHLGHPSRGGLRQYINSSTYQDLPTATWARIVFLRTIAGVSSERIWEVEPPAVSYLPRGVVNEEATTTEPKLDSFTRLISQSSSSSSSTSSCDVYSPFSNPDLWKRLKRSSYPSMVPTNTNFLNYLVLIGLSTRVVGERWWPSVGLLEDGSVTTTTTKTTEDVVVIPPPCPNEIPLLLAWMRTLGVQPSRSTLSLALVCWGEVCADVDAYYGSGGEGEKEYVKLVDYLTSWVGERRVPCWRSLERWRGILKKMREL